MFNEVIINIILLFDIYIYVVYNISISIKGGDGVGE